MNTVIRMPADESPRGIVTGRHRDWRERMAAPARGTRIRSEVCLPASLPGSAGPTFTGGGVCGGRLGCAEAFSVANIGQCVVVSHLLGERARMPPSLGRGTRPPSLKHHVSRHEPDLKQGLAARGLTGETLKVPNVAVADGLGQNWVGGLGGGEFTGLEPRVTRAGEVATKRFQESIEWHQDVCRDNVEGGGFFCRGHVFTRHEPRLGGLLLPFLKAIDAHAGGVDLLKARCVSGGGTRFAKRGAKGGREPRRCGERRPLSLGPNARWREGRERHHQQAEHFQQYASWPAALRSQPAKK
jgi:hypothetical protein